MKSKISRLSALARYVLTYVYVLMYVDVLYPYIKYRRKVWVSDHRDREGGFSHNNNNNNNNDVPTLDLAQKGIRSRKFF